MNNTTYAPKFINDTTVQVTKSFAQKAMIFGTPEYRCWRELKADCPAAVMATKVIKKNPEKRTSTRNMTYENMAAYIREQDNAKALMAEFEKQIAMSKVQRNPYRCVLAWFIQKFENYDNYKIFFEEEAKKEAEAKSIFKIVCPSATAESKETNEIHLALASNM